MSSKFSLIFTKAIYQIDYFVKNPKKNFWNSENVLHMKLQIKTFEISKIYPHHSLILMNYLIISYSDRRAPRKWFKECLKNPLDAVTSSIADGQL